MDRTTLLWTLVVFFGASVAFATLNNVTADSSTAVRVGVQLGALAIVIGGIVFAVRRMR
jgi:hypothetical protein